MCISCRYLLLVLSLSFVGLAQNLDKRESQREVHKGNTSLKSDDFSDAEYHYKNAISKDTTNTSALYNLGTSYYDKEKYDQAIVKFLKAAKVAKTKSDRHRISHNLGNAFMEKKDYTGALKAYHNALINDPTDEETRYNYSLAKALLKNDPPKSDKDKKKNKNKKEDKGKKQQDKKQREKQKKKKEDKKSDEKQDKGKNKKDDRNKNSNTAKPKNQKGKMSPQMAKNILNAIDKEEQKVQKRLDGKKIKSETKSVNREKDW